MWNRIFSVILFVIAAAGLAVGQKPDWYEKVKQIKLLNSSYDDVIKILGTPSDGSADKKLETFDIPQGRIFVDFASGQCVESFTHDGSLMGWKVPEWTVTNVSFWPDIAVRIKQLPFKVGSDFHKSEIYDVPGAFMFENKQSGVSFGQKRNGNVEIVSFAPPSEFDHLRCK